MVYSMLSAGMVWEKVEKGIDLETGKITDIDDIFHQYDVDYLLQADPDELAKEINEFCNARFTHIQMKALINTNIKKLLNLEENYNGIDNYYKKFIDEDKTLKTLVDQLANTRKDKYEQMAEALVAEYLKNVGYSLAKPDTHIRRILGSKILGCSEYEEVPVYDVFDIVQQIADETNKPPAEVDYILWAYCATGYGQICTTKYDNCENCVAKDICNKNN